MVHEVYMGKKKRMSFSRINEVLDMPDLIEVQKNSYQRFVEEDLKEVLDDISPITDYSEKLVLEFVDYSIDFDHPKYSVEECKERDVNYCAPLRVTVRLINKETGEVKILDYAAIVDCGTVINPNLARVQVEGGLVQGIGMTLFENIQYTDKGQMINNSFMQYKVPTRLDMGKLRVEFRSSYEPTGPFGAKSIGEIVINTPAPALAHAIYNATGLWFRELPITSEQIAMGIAEKECE